VLASGRLQKRALLCLHGFIRVYLVALLLCETATGCDWNDETASFRTEPLEPYTQQIFQGRPKPWTTTPHRIVEYLLRPPGREAGIVTYQEVHHLNGIVTLIATQEGVLDSESYAVRRVLTFVSQRVNVKVGYKCQKSDRRYSGHGCAK
jgi:hypothetical protein